VCCCRLSQCFLLSSDQGRPQTHSDNSALYPTVRNDIVQSKGLVREEDYIRNNIGKGRLKCQGNCETCQPCHSHSLKLGSDTRNYQHSGNGDYNPGYPDAIPDILTSCLEAPAFLAIAVSPRRNSSPTIAQSVERLTICIRSVNRSDSYHSFATQMPACCWKTLGPRIPGAVSVCERSCRGTGHRPPLAHPR